MADNSRGLIPGDTGRVSRAMPGDTSRGTLSPSGSQSGANADREFLRTMSDRHEALVQLASASMDKASNATTKSDARKLHAQLEKEQDSMVATLKSEFNDNYTPKATDQADQQGESLESLRGASLDSAFYRMVVQHHKESIALIDSMLPRLQKQDVKRMATKLKTDEQKEISAFERKANG